MLTSKEVLEKTGISRATLNNYISCGIVARPEVLPPQPSDGDAPRIGYFPADVVDRIEEIQRLKREGWSITRITEHFAGDGASARPGAAAAPRSAMPVLKEEARGEAMPYLSFGEIAHPAYLVNSRFEVVWMTAAAGSAAWPNSVPLPPEALSQAVLQYVLREQGQRDPITAESRQAILRLHLGLARQRGTRIADLCRGLPRDEAVAVEGLYEQADRFDFPLVVRAPVVPSRPGAPSPVYLYALNFREGILFIYIPDATAATDVSALLERPAPAANPARKAAPVLAEVAVLVADLQDASRLWSELPAEEYFELVNDIWLTLAPIVHRHHGTTARHPGEGIVCCFTSRAGAGHLWNALAAAHDVREAMRRLSQQWQLRKGWPTELFLNSGLDEGREWQGSLGPDPQGDLTVLGDAASHATLISSVGRAGAIWATRNLVGKLRPDLRGRLTYGVRRAGEDARHMVVSSTFSQVENLVDLAAAGRENLKPIARLPITEILDIAVSDDAAGRDSL